MKKRHVLLVALGLVLALGSGAQALPKTRVIMFCTGEAQGVFNALGGGLISAMKKDMPEQNFKITNTSGAQANCKLVGEEVMDLGLSHGETLGFAAVGDSRGGSRQPLPNIRVVAALFSNYLHVVVAKDAGAGKLEDLKGKRINLGPAGSGTAVTADLLLETLGFKRLDLSRVCNRPLTDNPQKFRQNGLDAAIVVQGLPSDHAAKALAAGGALMPIPPEIYQAMAGFNKSYRYQPIPKGTYEGQDQDVPTVSVPTFLITNAKLDDDTVYKITKALFSHKDLLLAAHPSAKEISLAGAAQNPPVPLHPGAARFYREKGVIK